MLPFAYKKVRSAQKHCLAGQKGRLPQLRGIAKEGRSNAEGRGAFTYFVN